VIGWRPIASGAMARPVPSLSAFDVACRWLARTPRSVAEIAARLGEIGFSPRAVQDAVTRLVHLGFVDDDALARSRATTLAARGYGDLWIERDLGRRSLGDEVVARALESLPAETERARAWLARAGPRRPGRAAWGALSRRGFAPETLEDVLGVAGDDADDAGPDGGSWD